jgi:hypothetical protein
MPGQIRNPLLSVFEKAALEIANAMGAPSGKS